MAKVIQDLWVLTEAGIVVFSRVYDQKVNEQLFGAVMTALHTFALELASGGLSNFELSSIRFTILKAQNFLFVANASKKYKEKKIQEELKKISEKFFLKYSDVLLNWDYEINVFNDFEKEIENKLEDPIKIFWKDF